MKLFLYPNITSQRYIEKVMICIEKLIAKGYECFLYEKDRKILDTEKLLSCDSVKGCDLIVTLGGDGTFLRGAQIALDNDMPICGINCGHLGFLCTYNLSNIDEIDFASLKCREYDLLQYDDGDLIYALNDIVIGKDYFGGTISLSVYVNDEKKYDFIGDGLIVSTPLGSTAYNYSAGGVKLDSDSHKLAVTPICPHRKGVDPFVTDENDVITVKLLKYSASSYADGILVSSFSQGSITSAKRKIKMLVR